jgi:hypothetical protein
LGAAENRRAFLSVNVPEPAPDATGKFPSHALVPIEGFIDNNLGAGRL